MWAKNWWILQVGGQLSNIEISAFQARPSTLSRGRDRGEYESPGEKPLRSELRTPDFLHIIWIDCESKP